MRVFDGEKSSFFSPKCGEVHLGSAQPVTEYSSGFMFYFQIRVLKHEADVLTCSSEPLNSISVGYDGGGKIGKKEDIKTFNVQDNLNNCRILFLSWT